MNLITPEEIDQILNVRILKLASKLSLIFQRETLRPRGIDVQQWRILVSLSLNGEMHQRSLAHHSTQDPAHTSRVVKAMIAKGWIESRSDEHDQRKILYSLTQTAAEIVKEVWPHAKQIGADVGGLFSEDEFQHLKKMLDRATAFCEDRLENGNVA
ncbi:MAG: MarR family winged helix-turn-helix transcriptional regulator [Paracoccaceae bacterium]|jgi:DNA-binding MarR family transcriptional regulator|tara:strand:+ start:326 stop:793 length:468 start_codon:yes stop_codon:yes gene_type:complete